MCQENGCRPPGISVGTLAPGEVHPASHSAMRYIRSLGLHKQTRYLEAFASCGIERNRLGEICSETLNRIMSGMPVSDRYLCALAWTIREMEENNYPSGNVSHLSRDEVIRLAMETNLVELWGFIEMYSHGRCTWEEAMQGAAVHLAQHAATRRNAQSALAFGARPSHDRGGSHG